jgi:hypothetical protein
VVLILVDVLPTKVALRLTRWVVGEQAWREGMEAVAARDRFERNSLR